MITTDEASTGAAVARPPWWRRKVGIVSCVVAALVILGTVATVIIVHLIPPAKLVPGLDDDPPELAKGINYFSFTSRSDVLSVALGENFCSSRDVTITSVSLYKPSPGIALTRWGLQNHGTDGQYGELPASLANFGHYTSRTITDHCNDSTEYAGVGLELHLTRPGTQSFLGVRMTYQSDGRQRVGYVWVQVTIHRPSTR